MCDVVSLAYAVSAASTAVASNAIARQGEQSGRRAAARTTPLTPQEQAEQERMTAEAEAQQRANLRIAEDQRRRREQQSLLARGAAAAPAPTMGAAPITDGDSLIGTPGIRPPRRGRSTTLLARGAAGTSAGSAPTLGGGDAGRLLNRVQA